MNSLTFKISGIICGILLLVSFVLGLGGYLFFPETFIDPFLGWSEFMAGVILLLGLLIVAPIWGLINLIIKLSYNYEKRKKELIIWILVLAVIPITLLVGYNVIASDTLPTFFGVEDYNLTIGKSKLVDAALYTTYFFAVCAILGALFTFVKDILTGNKASK